MILIVGSTGFLGGLITRQLLAARRPVRILARQGSNYQPLVELGALPVMGDLKDPNSLEAACKGVDVVISTANSMLRGGEDNPYSVEMQGNRNLIEASKRAGVKQFIFVSVAGYDPESRIPFVAGKSMTEDTLRESGLTYTILAPGPFTEVWLGLAIAAPLAKRMPVTVVGNGQGKQAMISIHDVANFAIASIDNPAANNRRIALAGPKACSFCEYVSTFERLLGCAIELRFIEPGQRVPLIPPVMQGTLVGLCMSGYSVPMEDTARTFNITLTPPETVIARLLRSNELLVPVHG